MPEQDTREAADDELIEEVRRLRNDPADTAERQRVMQEMDEVSAASPDDKAVPPAPP